MTDAPKNPVQTYSRKAERLGEQIAKRNSDPKLITEVVQAVRLQANEISGFIIENSGVREGQGKGFKRSR